MPGYSLRKDRVRPFQGASHVTHVEERSSSMVVESLQVLRVYTSTACAGRRPAPFHFILRRIPRSARKRKKAASAKQIHPAVHTTVSPSLQGQSLCFHDPETPNWATSVGASYHPVRNPWRSHARR